MSGECMQEQNDTKINLARRRRGNNNKYLTATATCNWGLLPGWHASRTRGGAQLFSNGR